MPFADHNAMLDPSCPDITARVLEALGHYGYRRRASAGATAPSPSSRETQEPRGCWIGRWGVNYLYGTWQVLCGPAQHRLRHAATRWCGAPSPGCKQVQQAGGGWGETCRSYDDPVAGRPGHADRVADGLGPARRCSPPARQTATPSAPASTTCCTRSGDDGNWQRGAVHRHRLPEGLLPEISPVPLYFPLMALARYQQTAKTPRTPRDRERLDTIHLRPITPNLSFSSWCSWRLATGSQEDSIHAFPAQSDDEHGRLHGPQEADRARSAFRWC